MTHRLKFLGALSALTVLMVGICAGTVYVVSIVVPLVEGGQLCTGSECYAITITINGEAAHFEPILRLDALFVTFMVAFCTTSLFWFTLKDVVERYLPIVVTLPPREREGQVKTKEVNP